MLDKFNLDTERNRSIVVLLLEMAHKDDFCSPIELKYISHIAQQLGISQEEVEHLNAHPDQCIFEAPKSEQERMTIFYFLLFTMRSDGVIKQVEVNYLYDIGLRLGLNPALIEDLIGVIKAYVKDELPPSVMLEQIRKYLN